jgi:hypothetical protein
LAHRATKLQQFGQKLAHVVQELNTLCQEFFRYINSTVFEDEEQIQDALSVFQTSVMKSAVGTDRYKKQFYDQIERMLLNPPAHVAESRPRLGQGMHNVVTLFQQVSREASLPKMKCSVCSGQGGLMVLCSKLRCKKPMHVACAALKTISKRFNGISFYHCPSCQAKIQAPSKPRKRKSEEQLTKGGNSDQASAGTDEDKEEKSLASISLEHTRGSGAKSSVSDGESVSQSDEGENSDDSNYPGSSAIRHDNSGPAAGGTNASASSDSGSDATPTPPVDDAKVFVFDDCIFEGAMVDASSTVESEGSWINLRSSDSGSDAPPKPFPHVGSDLSSSIRGACTGLFFMKHSILNLKMDLETTRTSVQTSVSHQNADQIRDCLTQIRSGIDNLTTLARQIQVGYGISLAADSQPFGGGVDASDILQYAVLENSDFDRRVSNLLIEFEALHAYSVKSFLTGDILDASGVPIGLTSPSSPAIEPLPDCLVAPASSGLITVLHSPVYPVDLSFARSADADAADVAVLTPPVPPIAPSAVVSSLAPLPASTSSVVSTLPADVLQPSSFWTTLSSNMDVGHYLNIRYNCKFEEHTNEKGTLIKSRPQVDSGTLHWQDAHHFVSETYVAKVYRLLLHSSHDTRSKEFISNLSKALHECAATAFVCDKKKWFHEVFGVVFHEADTSHLHICLVRARLHSADLTPEQTSVAVIDLLKQFGVMHGDCHVGNAKLRSDGVLELLDFERSFFPNSTNMGEMIHMIKLYANNPRTHDKLLGQWQNMGMDETRRRFRQLARTSNIFDIKMDQLLSLFKDKA